jgi:hypothetical protein
MGAATGALTAMAFTSRLCGLPGQVLKGAVREVIDVVKAGTPPRILCSAAVAGDARGREESRGT